MAAVKWARGTVLDGSEPASKQRSQVRPLLAAAPQTVIGVPSNQITGGRACVRVVGPVGDIPLWAPRLPAAAPRLLNSALAVHLSGYPVGSCPGDHRSLPGPCRWDRLSRCWSPCRLLLPQDRRSSVSPVAPQLRAWPSCCPGWSWSCPLTRGWSSSCSPAAACDTARPRRGASRLGPTNSTVAKEVT